MALNIQRLNFDPVTGDNASEAFMKLDTDIGEIAEAIDGDGTPGTGLDGRITTVEASVASIDSVIDGLGNSSTKDVGTASGTVAAGDDTRITGAASKTYVDSTFFPKAGGTVAGSVTVTGSANKMPALGLNIPGAAGAAGSLDVRTGNGGFVFRTNGVESVIDGITNDNSGYAGFNCSGTVFSYYSRTGDGRLLMRVNTNMSLDSVNGANNAFRPMTFTSTGYTFNGGNMQVNGNITASGSITPSDERLKENVTPRAVARGMALAMAKAYSEWDLISNGLHQAGVIAQVMQGINPFHVSEIDYAPPPEFEEGTTNVTYFPTVKRLAVDNVGMALEASMDNALDIDDLKQALAAALARITALEAR